jgi:transposase
MSKARLIVTAVITEKRRVSEVARSYEVARSWIYTLLKRYEAEGEAAFEPRSRRPKTSPRAISAHVSELIIRLRKELTDQGLDAGPVTIAWHLARHHQVTVSAATVIRCLHRAGLVVPEPRKRPKSSYIRFAAEQPNECWQSGFTHYPLAGGTGSEILTWLDDHARYALSVTAHHRVTGPIVVAAFQAAVAAHGAPASTLTDIQDGWCLRDAARCPAGGVRLLGTGACPSSLLTDRSVREHGFLPVDHEAGGGIAEEGSSC